jgi:hypothetical protein
VPAEELGDLNLDADRAGARPEEAPKQRGDGSMNAGFGAPRAIAPRRTFSRLLAALKPGSANFDFRVTSLRPRNSMSIRRRCSWSRKSIGLRSRSGPFSMASRSVTAPFLLRSLFFQSFFSSFH